MQFVLLSIHSFPDLSVITTRDWGGSEVLIEPPEYAWDGVKMFPDELPWTVRDKLPWLSQVTGVTLSIPHQWLCDFQMSVNNRLGQGQTRQFTTLLKHQCGRETAWVLAFLVHAEDFAGVFNETIEEAIERLAREVSFDSHMTGFVSCYRATVEEDAARSA